MVGDLSIGGMRYLYFGWIEREVIWYADHNVRQTVGTDDVTWWESTNATTEKTGQLDFYSWFFPPSCTG